MHVFMYIPLCAYVQLYMYVEKFIYMYMYTYVILEEFNRIFEKPNLVSICRNKWAELMPKLLKIDRGKAASVLEYTDSEVTTGNSNLIPYHF